MVMEGVDRSGLNDEAHYMPVVSREDERPSLIMTTQVRASNCQSCQNVKIPS
jgi:hypothetical protein